MDTRVRIAHHPIHPVLIPIPIGLFVVTLIADIAYRIGGPPVWDTVAFYALATGIVGALVAAVPGFLDYLSMPSSRAREIATAHMGFNLTVGALQAVNLWLRTRSGTGGGGPFVLATLPVVLLGGP